MMPHANAQFSGEIKELRGGITPTDALTKNLAVGIRGADSSFPAGRRRRASPAPVIRGKHRFPPHITATLFSGRVGEPSPSRRQKKQRALYHCSVCVHLLLFSQATWLMVFSTPLLGLFQSNLVPPEWTHKLAQMQNQY